MLEPRTAKHKSWRVAFFFCFHFGIPKIAIPTLRRVPVLEARSNAEKKLSSAEQAWPADFFKTRYTKRGRLKSTGSDEECTP